MLGDRPASVQAALLAVCSRRSAWSSRRGRFALEELDVRARWVRAVAVAGGVEGPSTASGRLIRAYSISAASCCAASPAWLGDVGGIADMRPSPGVVSVAGLVDRARAAASPVQQVVSDGGQVAGFQVGGVADGGVDVDLGPGEN